ncbi:MAG: spore coat protein U domain-containing protein [Deltaproteobacteria bacterium]|nr:spore coat protein U domain-containing protein [Deltaproteobacteria bacterium]
MKRSLLSLVLFAFALPAMADTETGTLNVTASVPGTCTIGDATLAFGSYTGAELDASTDFTVACTGGIEWDWIGLDGTIGSRTMDDGGTETLAYELYTDSDRLDAWGNLETDGLPYGAGYATTVPVYGRIEAGASPAAGSYSATVTATVNF